MAILNLCFTLCYVLFRQTSAASAERPTDVKIMVNCSALTANVSWNIPTKLDVTFTRVKFDLNVPKYNDVHFPTSHYMIKDRLQRKMEYTVKLKIYDKKKTWLPDAEYNFVMSDLEVPRDVEVKINESSLTANVTWKAPLNVYVKHTSIVLIMKDSNGQRLPINHTTVPSNFTQFDVKLKKCKEYILELKFCYSEAQCSEATKQMIVISDNNYTAKIDNNVTIIWETALRARYNVKSSSVDVLYTISPGGKLSPVISNRSKYAFEDNVTHTINITLMFITISDAGLYWTENELNFEAESCALLIVKDAPKTPHLSIHPEVIFVGDNITFMCRSSVNRWPEHVSSSLSYKYEGINGTENGNNLGVTKVSQNQKGLNVTCKATDDLHLVSGTSNVITVDPYYGPDNSIDIASNTKSVTIPEGSQLGPFNCTAHCNPSCTIQWIAYFNGNMETVYSSSKLNITNIQRNQTGIYSCKAIHPYDNNRNTSKNMTVHVQYGPNEVNISRYEETVNIYEGMQFGPYTCSADCNPHCTLNWKANLTGKFKTIQSESVLNIANIGRNQTGTYRCKATNKINERGKRKDMMVTVEYGPDAVIIEPYNQTITIYEGDTFGPFNCSTDCFPSCNIQWRMGNTPVKDDPKSTLYITSIQRNQAGTYHCKATHPSNHTRKKENTITVSVLYPSTITEVKLKPGSYQEGENFSFSESTILEISLRVEGNPDAVVYFYKNGTKKTPANVSKNGSTYTISENGLRCEDSGQYIIEASNSVRNSSDKENLLLDILCKPRDINFANYIFGTTVTAVENINVTLVANPTPDIEWIRQTGHDWIVISLGNNSYIGYSKITINDVNSFGNYGVKICNKLSCSVENVIIKAEGKPDPPRNFSVEEFTHDSAQFSFIAGFDGGHEQTFVIQYKPIDTSHLNFIEQTIVTNDTRKDVKIVHTLEGLSPNTQYYVTVMAENRHGNSSAFVKFRTNTAPVAAPEGLMSAGAGAGIGIVVAILVIALVALFLVRRRRQNSKEGNYVDNIPTNVPKASDDDENKGDAAEYACVSKVKQNAKKTTELVSDEYAFVSKVPTNDKNKKRKPSTEDDYLNETLYSNQEEVELLEKTTQPTRTQNADGLVYIEVEFTKPPSCTNRKPIIHGDDSRTDYVDIDFNKRADPLPDDDETS